MSRALYGKNTWRGVLLSWLGREIISPEKRVSRVEKETAPLILLNISARNRKGCILAVMPVLSEAEHFYNEFNIYNRTLGCNIRSAFLPEVSEGKKYLPGNESERANTIFKTLKGEVDIVFSSVSGFLAPVPPPDEILNSELIIQTGMKLKFKAFVEQLVKLDYDDEFEVNVHGEFSRRGGIVDIFSPSAKMPVRVEFWGDEIESMREFEPETQRSVRTITEYRIIRRTAIPDETCTSNFFRCAGKAVSRTAVLSPSQCTLHIKRFLEKEDCEEWEKYLEVNEKSGKAVLLLDEVESGNINETTQTACFPATAHLQEREIDDGSGSSSEIIRQFTASRINQWLETGYEVTLAGINEGSLPHIEKWCEEYGVDSRRIQMALAPLPCGLIFPESNFIFLTEKEIFSSAGGFRKTPEPGSLPRHENFGKPEKIDITDIEEREPAVHLLHGIGIYKGMRELESGGITKEVIVMEFADEKQLFIPLSQAHMITRYAGAGKAGAKLSRLGTAAWKKARTEAGHSVKELAAEMIRLQAARNASEGFAFPEDDIWQKMFEDSFKFTATIDQLKASEEIKSDMSSPKPMDRLLCGDVGFGKTEVAIRAAFKCVATGKQVAVLVPTTILAQQHYYCFSERFAEHPVIIEMLSSFKTGAEQKKILRRLEEKKIDIVIGTHRLLQGDMKFSDLGLVIIDEEQRFGVEHKNNFKKLRTTVDVLTMTATPIPRTLYMAVTGARDLSTIMTAPGQRLPVQTAVAPFNNEIISSAVRAEIGRGGQVFFVHNRVKTIEKTAEFLQKLIPEASFATAHGQMREHKLENIMTEFIKGEIDVLVCTTIIESGLDIPNANTMLIERADRFGLAELYQLRGRIGRWSKQAYAYMLLPPEGLPAGDARKRIAAIRRYTHLGAGFKLALRDLEIRGAGNLLGAEQSGHINAVGFELYCNLLRNAVTRMKGGKIEFIPKTEMNLDFVEYGHRAAGTTAVAGFPPEYINCPRLRIEAYRKLNSITSFEDINKLEEELTDRYGSLPKQARYLICIATARLSAAKASISSVTTIGGKIIIKRGTRIMRVEGKIPLFPEKLTCYDKIKFLVNFFKNFTPE